MVPAAVRLRGKNSKSRLYRLAYVEEYKEYKENKENKEYKEYKEYKVDTKLINKWLFYSLETAKTQAWNLVIQLWAKIIFPSYPKTISKNLSIK